MNIYKLGREERRKHLIKRRIEQSIAQQFDGMFSKGTAKKIDKILKDYDPAEEARLEREENDRVRKYGELWVRGGHTVSKHDYCNIHEIPLNKFNYWTRKRRRELNKLFKEAKFAAIERYAF